MGMSKSEFVDKILRLQYGRRTTRINQAMREGKQRYCNGDAYAIRSEGRIRQTKNLPRSKQKRF